MTCQYPDLASITGYNKGCRCGRCRQAMSIVNRRSKKHQCFEGGMSQASIDRWAQDVAAAMLPSELRLLRELDI